ncbi:MAG TPA: YCF48-related protein [Bacteroidales bacterium]|nr:YCF48-related protein [Bacteroidales bacterium]
MKILIAITITVILACLITGCKKDNNGFEHGPLPVMGKKYAWVCGEPDSTGYGMLLFSKDGGETWVRQGVGTPEFFGVNFLDIWAIDENTVWVVGADNTVLKTTDGGQSWIKVDLSFNPSNPALYSISVSNKTSVWISGENGTVYNSTDEGNSWTMCDTTFFDKAFLQGICAINQNEIYVAGGIDLGGSMRGYIAYTLDGGVTWDTVTPENNFNRYEWIGVCAYGNSIVVYGSTSHYIVSIDGGITWENDSIPNTGGGFGGADINHLIMINSQVWWGALDLGQVYITKDGGANWTQQQTVGISQFFMLGFDAFDNNCAISVGAQAGFVNDCPIIKTSNGGVSWEQKYTSTNASLHKVTFIKD